MEGGCSPIVTVPRDFSFHNSLPNKTSPKDGDEISGDESSSGYPIYLTEDWGSGIGGGLWTTGLALARYFTTSQHFLDEFRRLKASKKKQNPRRHRRHHHHKICDTNNQQQEQQQQQQPVRVLELGSGNGFLSVCLVAAIAVAESNDIGDKREGENGIGDRTASSPAGLPSSWPGIEVVVTDTAEHLSLMRTTIESNLRRILPHIRNNQSPPTEGSLSENSVWTTAIEKIARVEEYLWGEDYNFGGGCDSGGGDVSESKHQTEPNEAFDLIIGSDVAYRDHLHDPLIAALEEFCVPQHTVALIGVTMNDTKPIFFEKLHERGFLYEKLAEHLLGEEFCSSSRQFGVFCITKR